MAESAVSLVVDKLLSLLRREVKLLKGVHDELVDVKDELEVIRAFLKDADSKAEKEGIGEGVKVLVHQIREEAHHIEDVIDDYMLHVAGHPDHRHGLLRRIASFIKTFYSRREIALEVKYIKSSLLDIKNRSQTFQFISSNQRASSSSSSNAARGLMHLPRLSSLFTEEADLVGIESPRDECISYLVSGHSQRTVIAVVGMGGVGKTTMAKKVYDNHRVKEHFRYHAWITVSQSYDNKELLRSILKGFHEARNEPFPDRFVPMYEEELIKEIREYLRQERYVVVFDDVWEIGFWGNMEHALLDHDNGSRILATTRNEDVANFSRGSSMVHVYRIEPLPLKEAWELFCKKAFRFEFKGQCPKELEELSHDIVRRCGGLPLAIVAVSGLLATKEKSIIEWQKVLIGLAGSAMVSDPYIDNVTNIISLSFGDLPCNLKSCFLYFGMFPEDFSIRCRRIIQLWVAEGFVQEKPGMTLEEVGEEYIIELIRRSLVQVDKVSFKAILKACRVHDLVRDVILSKSKDLSLCHVSCSCTAFEGIARHLSIRNRGSNTLKNSTKSQTRSIMVFDEVSLQKASISVMFAKFKLLTTLDFENCSIDHLPKNLGNLLHLRCLNLRDTNIVFLPKSIKKLHNLEFLELRYSFVQKLPVEICNFPKLRHLLGHGRNTLGFKIKGSIKDLEFLQTLSVITVDHDVSFINDGLQGLTKMRKLGIKNLKREHGRYLCTALEKLTHLRSLFVSSINPMNEILEMQSISSPPLQLRSLRLEGQLERLPNWISVLHNLAKLTLHFSNLMDDSIEVLQALPNLNTLGCFHAYNGGKMHFKGGGFQKLKFLGLVYLSNLNEMLIEEGALPLLERLAMRYCAKLREVPSGLQNLKYLKHLSFLGMTNELTQRLSQQESEIATNGLNLQYDGSYDLDDEERYRAWEKRNYG